MLDHNRLCFVFSVFFLGLQAKNVSIQAWNFHHVQSAKPLNSRTPNFGTATEDDAFTDQKESLASRRQVLSSTLSASVGLALTWPTSPALARNMPVSNGADTSKVGTVSALMPIVELRTNIQVLQQMIREEKKANTDGQLSAIAKTKTSISFTNSNGGKTATIPVVEKDFKRLFDAYSDQVSYKQKFLDQNAFLVYYTNGYDGPGRDSLEKDPVNERQTLQFGARNEAWIGWDDFLAEWGYYSSTSLSSKNNEDTDESFSELMKYLSNTLDAVDRYLRLSPPQDLEAVQQTTLSHKSPDTAF